MSLQFENTANQACAEVSAVNLGTTSMAKHFVDTFHDARAKAAAYLAIASAILSLSSAPQAQATELRTVSPDYPGLITNVIVNSQTGQSVTNYFVPTGIIIEENRLGVAPKEGGASIAIGESISTHDTVVSGRLFDGPARVLEYSVRVNYVSGAPDREEWIRIVTAGDGGPHLTMEGAGLTPPYRSELGQSVVFDTREGVANARVIGQEQSGARVSWSNSSISSEQQHPGVIWSMINLADSNLIVAVGATPENPSMAYVGARMGGSAARTSVNASDSQGESRAYIVGVDRTLFMAVGEIDFFHAQGQLEGTHLPDYIKLEKLEQVNVSAGVIEPLPPPSLGGIRVDPNGKFVISLSEGTNPADFGVKYKLMFSEKVDGQQVNWKELTDFQLVEGSKQVTVSLSQLYPENVPNTGFFTLENKPE